MQGVLLRASFRRSPVSGKKFFTVSSLNISNINAKKKGIAKKLILTLRAIMISQEVDLVAGDFNGTAWRCRSRDNLSTIDEAFTDCALPTPPGHTIVGTWIHSGQLGRRLQISQTTRLSPFLDGDQAWCIFPFLAKPLVYVQPIKVAITKHGFISVLLTGALPGPEKMIMNGIFLSKNGLQIGHTGTKNDVLAKS